MAQAERIEVAGEAGAAVDWRQSWTGWALSILGVAVVIYASYLIFVGSVDGLTGRPQSTMNLRHGAVISTLISFVLVSRLLMTRHLRGDIAALAPLLPDAKPPEPSGAREFAPPGQVVSALLGAALGFAVVIASYGSLAGLRARFDGHAMWAVVANLALFAVMAQLAWSQQAAERFLHRTVTSRLRVPLLDGASLAPYARRGLRGCFFWFLGSSIASLLFINWGFSWTVFAVIVCTLGLGCFALLEPSRRLRRRVRQAKQEELARARVAIEEARTGAVDGRDAAAAARLPGLLAWEARVESVHEWPFDVSTWLRFGLLAVLAVGSWLGGALVERVLSVALEG